MVSIFIYITERYGICVVMVSIFIYITESYNQYTLVVEQTMLAYTCVVTILAHTFMQENTITSTTHAQIKHQSNFSSI